MIMHLILYSKAGCHLCEVLLEKLEQIKSIDLTLDVRDITQNQDWFSQYEFEVPVLCFLQEDKLFQLPRPSPRLSVRQLEAFLAKYL